MPANKPTSKQEPKKPVSFREANAKQRTKAAKPRALRKTASGAARSARFAKRGVHKVVKPFGFLLIPFKTRPARFVGRILSKLFLVEYFRGSWKELRQVTCPNRKETAKLTMAVIVFTLVFGVFITVVDYGLDKIFRFIIL